MAKPRPIRSPYPAAQERLLRVLLLNIVNALHRALMAEMPGAFKSASAEFRGDAWPERVEAAVARIAASFKVKLDPSARAIYEIGEDVARLNKNAFQRLIRALMGVDAIKSEGKWLDDLIKSWARENASLVTSIVDEHAAKIERLTQTAVRSGRSMVSYRAELQELLGVSQRRAETIARDQVGKLNGQITMARQQRAGIDTYTWDTSGDERVRESHRVLEGKTCRWDDPTVYRGEDGEWHPRSDIGAYVGHPGEDIQCRCVATSNVEELLDQLEAA